MSLSIYAQIFLRDLTTASIDANDGILISKIGMTKNQRGRRSGYHPASICHQKSWRDVVGLKTDTDLHRKLRQLGWRDGNSQPVYGFNTKHASREAFVLPKRFIPRGIMTPDQLLQFAFNTIDTILAGFAPLNDKLPVVLRSIQRKVVNDILADFDADSLRQMAVLAPRAGKSLIMLMVGADLQRQGLIKHIVLPAYWLSVLPSYKAEWDKYRDFGAFQYITRDNVDEFDSSKPSIIEVSLAGDLNGWKRKHAKVAELNPTECLFVVDEADFGAHTDNQLAKLCHLGAFHKSTRFIATSGTKPFRMALTAQSIDRVHYLSYATLERQPHQEFVPDYIKRRYYTLQWDGLRDSLSKAGIQDTDFPTWRKVWNKPDVNHKQIEAVFCALVGEPYPAKNPMPVPGFNLNAATGEDIRGIMAFTSAEIANMAIAAKHIQRVLPDWHVIVLNSETSSNATAGIDVSGEINRECVAGNKRGFIILTNSMGCRSFSEPRVQASVLMYDRGDMDVTAQKGPRCLTPGQALGQSFAAGERRVYGHIVSLSFDGNRSQEHGDAMMHDALIRKGEVSGVIKDMVWQDASIAQKEQGGDIIKSLRYVLNSCNHLMVDQNGTLFESSIDDLLDEYSAPDVLEQVDRALTDKSVLMDQDLLDVLERNIDTLNLDKVAAKRLQELLKLSKTYGNNERGKQPTKEQKTLTDMMVKFISRLKTIGSDVSHYLDKPTTLVEALDQLPAKYSDELAANYGMPFKDIRLFVDRGAVTLDIQDLVIRKRIEMRSLDLCDQQAYNGRYYQSIANKKQADLGQMDPVELWHEIISAMKVDWSKRQRVLVLAGGQAGELEALSQITDVREHEIVFNDIQHRWCLNAQRRFGAKIVPGNALDPGVWDDMKQFDVVIMNPPYQSKHRVGRSPLWPFFVDLAFRKLVKSDGWVACICPNKWFGHTRIARTDIGEVHLYQKWLRGKLTSVNVGSVNDHFQAGGYTDMFSYFVANNAGSPSFEFTERSGSTTVDADFEFLPLQNLTALTASILSKTKTTQTWDMRADVGPYHNKRVRGAILVPLARFYNMTHDAIWDDGQTKLANQLNMVTRTDYAGSSQKKVTAIFGSKLFRFITACYWNQDSLYSNFYNSLPYLDPVRSWTDKAIYDHFGLTQAERDYIESEVK